MQLNNKQELVPRPYWFVLVAILGLAIRLIGMGRQSLWLDEMTSIQVAGEPLYKILKGQVFDNFTPPLYYVLLHFWGSIVPLTETTLRLPSALIDFCNIFLLMALCRHYISRISTFVVVSAYAISPFMLYYAQEGRMYTLVVFFAMVYCLALERIVRTERHLMVWTAVSGVVLALGVYTHYYFKTNRGIQWPNFSSIYFYCSAIYSFSICSWLCCFSAQHAFKDELLE